ncbi:MAG TPA: hypothetical protein VLZ11_04990 [Flavobacterium sp.]|nr:hypothetical protein [Flavobacterium sp.]
MEVIDTLGIKNYTFKILNHPEDNYKTFHNLVLTEKENSLEVTVLKYEMSDFFAQQFDNAPETFINFEGTITSRGLATSPCDELIIDFPGNGNPGSGGGGGSGGCTQVDISFVCDNCNRSYGNWDTYSGSVCGNGNYGLTIVIT